MARRTPSYQNVAWFLDLARNGQLDLDPPYQRLSFWNQTYRDFFVDSILNDYPVPAVFMFQEIDRDGHSMYHVVDGKQRLETILRYAQANEFPTPDSFTPGAGRYFRDLPDDIKRQFWEYQIPVENVPDTKEGVLREIFDRINRNVAKLRHQELRHARFDGAFIQLTERLAEQLHPGFPNISEAEKRRMRDVEYVGQLLVLLARGPISTSQEDLDQVYSQWDEEVPEDLRLEPRFLATQTAISSLLAAPDVVPPLQRTRFRNLADHFSLFGAVTDLMDNGWTPAPAATSVGLVAFANRVEAARQGETMATDDPEAYEYYEAARSASNDRGPRETRIAIIKEIISRVDGATS